MRHISEPFSVDKANRAFDSTVKAMKRSIETKRNSVMTWLVVDKLTQDKIGIASLSWAVQAKNCDDQNMLNNGFAGKEVEFGIILIREAHGKSNPEEAAIGLAEFAFSNFMVERVIARFNKSNLAVERFLRRIGFKQLLNEQRINNNECCWGLTQQQIPK